MARSNRVSNWWKDSSLCIPVCIDGLESVSNHRRSQSYPFPVFLLWWPCILIFMVSNPKKLFSTLDLIAIVHLCSYSSVETSKMVLWREAALASAAAFFTASLTDVFNCRLWGIACQSQLRCLQSSGDAEPSLASCQNFHLQVVIDT